jgi:hypothetical protein
MTSAKPTKKYIHQQNGGFSSNEEKTAIHSSTDGYNSDESVSSLGEQFQDLTSRGEKRQNVKDLRLGKDFFNNNKKGLNATVRFGESFSDEKDVEFSWEEHTEEVKLFWSLECNSHKEEGISCDNGLGWAGWSEKYKCYLHKNSAIFNQDLVERNCMKILEIEPSQEKTNKDKTKTAPQNNSNNIITEIITNMSNILATLSLNEQDNKKIKEILESKEVFENISTVLKKHTESESSSKKIKKQKIQRKNY